ncbi:unnamed protein product [Protopolystoma xenopodis]|uniref:Uncharacterized protein n=1 Tax=Protopolystoma xenopodis TaxID=117903 RepID=A0A3S5AXR1_9PLAT|nr:unnamed protein product [Protopolystoma xenopodis]
MPATLFFSVPRAQSLPGISFPVGAAPFASTNQAATSILSRYQLASTMPPQQQNEQKMRFQQPYQLHGLTQHPPHIMEANSLPTTSCFLPALSSAGYVPQTGLPILQPSFPLTRDQLEATNLLVGQALNSGITASEPMLAGHGQFVNFGPEGQLSASASDAISAIRNSNPFVSGQLATTSKVANSFFCNVPEHHRLEDFVQLMQDKSRRLERRLDAQEVDKDESSRR